MEISRNTGLRPQKGYSLKFYKAPLVAHRPTVRANPTAKAISTIMTITASAIEVRLAGFASPRLDALLRFRLPLILFSQTSVQCF